MVNVKDKITDGTVEWIVRDIRGGTDGNPPGTIVAFAGNTIPDGYLLCDGSAISRTYYADLFAAIGGTWGAGDGSTTFNLPNTINRFPEGAATVGGYINAGLPNITGSLSCSQNQLSGNGGALYTTGGGGYAHNNSWISGCTNGIYLNAALSNGLYGASTTVQPACFLVKYIMKY